MIIMSNLEIARADKAVGVLGIVPIVAGVTLFASGAVAWISVSRNLAEEDIVVSDDAARCAGDKVSGPFTAYQESAVIQKHALSATGGKSFAELAPDDPNRETAMTASFLRASLLTSVVAFGVAAMAMGLGVVSGVIGVALRRTSRRE
jgi:hypothetical protein